MSRTKYGWERWENLAPTFELGVVIFTGAAVSRVYEIVSLRE